MLAFMGLAISIDPVPLAVDADGVVRVGGTRVTLDVVVEAFGEGATAEEIVQQYPSLALADVYAVIAYYLRRRGEVDAYLAERGAAGRAAHAEIDNLVDRGELRKRLLARRPPAG